MTWSIDGTGKDLTFSVHSAGHWEIRGHGKHRCQPSGGDTGFLSAVARISEMGWTLYSPNTPKSDTETLFPGLWNRAQEAPSVAAITYLFHQNPASASLCAGARLAPDVASIIYDHCKSIRGTNIIYRLLLDFVGLRVPEAVVDVPSVSEFMAPDLLKRKPYFASHFTFIFPDHPLAT